MIAQQGERHEEAVRLIGEVIAADGAKLNFHNNVGELPRIFEVPRR